MVLAARGLGFPRRVLECDVDHAWRNRSFVIPNDAVTKAPNMWIRASQLFRAGIFWAGAGRSVACAMAPLKPYPVSFPAFWWNSTRLGAEGAHQTCGARRLMRGRMPPASANSFLFEGVAWHATPTASAVGAKHGPVPLIKTFVRAESPPRRPTDACTRAGAEWRQATVWDAAGWFKLSSQK